MDESDPAAGSGRAEEPGRPARGGLTASVARWVEVHRLAVAGREPVIARDVGDRVGRVLLPRSRFSDVAALARATLTLGPDAAALYDLGSALSSTGQHREALTCFQQALDLYREVGDRAGEESPGSTSR